MDFLFLIRHMFKAKVAPCVSSWSLVLTISQRVSEYIEAFLPVLIPHHDLFMWQISLNPTTDRIHGPLYPGCIPDLRLVNRATPHVVKQFVAVSHIIVSISIPLFLDG